MLLRLSLLMCLAAQLCWGELVEEEVVTARDPALGRSGRPAAVAWHRKNKDVPRLGGWFKIRPESDDVQKAAQHAVKMFNIDHNSRKMFKLITINAAQAQVTNVIKFEIDAILGRTKCLKAENQEPSSCSLERKQLTCRFVVTFNPRNDKHELLEQKCTTLQKKI